MSMTHDGKFCDKWNQYPGYETITHDYCRNFDDDKPWCFSGRKKVRLWLIVLVPDAIGNSYQCSKFNKERFQY